MKARLENFLKLVILRTECFDLRREALKILQQEASEKSVMLTSSGKMIDPTNILPDDICFSDICQSLSMQCRYAGHTATRELSEDETAVISEPQFYSVAAHSLMLFEIVIRCVDIEKTFRNMTHRPSSEELMFQSREIRVPHDFDMLSYVELFVLMTVISHDFTEGYVSDVPRGLKKKLANYDAIEDSARVAINSKIYEDSGVYKELSENYGDCAHKILSAIDDRVCALLEMPILMPGFASKYDVIAPGLLGCLLYDMFLNHEIVIRQDVDLKHTAEAIKHMLVGDTPGRHKSSLLFTFIRIKDQINGIHLKVG